MLRLRPPLAIALMMLGLPAERGHAGPFMMPEGQGQIIAGVGYIEASRTFDRGGRIEPVPTFRKAFATLYAEYGLTGWLTIIAAPTAARLQAGTPLNSYAGSDASAFGARLLLHSTASLVFAIQALVQPPLGGRDDAKTEFTFGGPRVSAADVRLQIGQNVSFLGWPSFVGLEPGVQVRGNGWPSEGRFDMVVGTKPRAGSLILLQSFSSVTPSAGPRFPRTSATKLQASIVQDLSRAWSLQIGFCGTVLGRDSARELGPFAALWFRF